MTLANAGAWFLQAALLVILCAGLPRVLGLRAPGVQYAFWRVLLALCVLLPIAQPWQHAEMGFVPAPAAAAVTHAAGGPPPSLPAAPAPPFDWAVALEIVLLLGIAARLGWLAAGVFRLRQLREKATDEAAGFDDLKETIGVSSPIYWSAEATHPVTFGLVRSVVLLPVALKRIDTAAQRAVVSHELHHVKRRDWVWALGEEIVRSIFWFHPAVWWLISRVQLARETVVDELSILTTNARRVYLDTLLAFADDTGLASTPAFSARRHLFHRVMLLSKEGNMSSLRLAAGSAALVLALGAGAFGAVYAFPLTDVAVGVAQSQNPPRDAMTPADYVQRSAAYLERAQKNLTLDRQDRIDVIKKGINADDRALAIDGNYVDAMMYKSALLRLESTLVTDQQEQMDLTKEADEIRAKVLVLRPTMPTRAPAAGYPAPPPPPPPPASPAFQALIEKYHPIRVGGNVKQPIKIRNVNPVYPPEAQAKRISGVVILQVLIDESGAVVDAAVLRSIPALDDAAIDAARQALYTPTLVDGQPRAVVMTITQNFTLQ